ncbi:MAG: hypothetical protein MJZ15_09435 [Bacteroidales bacterium]|nr:hypothetical protein [Bacteroidales bacterium]
MKRYLTEDEWCIVEDDFTPEGFRKTEDIFALDNGLMSMDGGFEEMCSDDGRKETPSIKGLGVCVDGEVVNMYVCNIAEYRRELNMREGYVERRMCVEVDKGKRLQVKARRFLSVADRSMAAISYSISPLNFTGRLSIMPYLELRTGGSMGREDVGVVEKMNMKSGYASMVVRHGGKAEAYTMRYRIMENRNELSLKPELIKKEAWVGNRVDINGQMGTTITVEKFIGHASTDDIVEDRIVELADATAMKALTKGFDRMMEEQKEVWTWIWEKNVTSESGGIEELRMARLKRFKELEKKR